MNYSAGRHVLSPACATVNGKTSRFKNLHLQRDQKMDSQSNQEDTIHKTACVSHSLRGMAWPICPFSAQSPGVTWFSPLRNKQLVPTLASHNTHTILGWRHSSLSFWRTWVRGEEVFQKLNDVNQNSCYLGHGPHCAHAGYTQSLRGIGFDNTEKITFS